MFPVVVRLFVVRAGISATCGVDFSSGAPHLSGWSARGGDPIPDGFSSANTHLVCFLVREHRELLERAGQRGASRARVRLVRNVHGGARHGVCSSGTDWFSVAGGASVTTAVRGGGWLGRSARRGGGGRERQTAARSRAFAVPRRARPSSNPDVLAARLAKALAFRMDGVRGRRTSGERVVWSRRRALGFDRAAHARVRVSFGSVPAHRGGDGEASPGAWFRRERRASRVVRETHRRGRDGCGCDSCASRFRGSRDRGLRTVPSFTSFTATHGFSQS